ncbi:hypothetical protein Q3G72_009253 [Acer saccharum]|nr:hypothetical protein Q3G72_009253 [Acer saccharum]
MVEKKGGHFNNIVKEEKKRSDELCILNNMNAAEVRKGLAVKDLLLRDYKYEVNEGDCSKSGFLERTKEDGPRGSFGSRLYGFGSKGRDKDLSRNQSEIQFHVLDVETDETYNGPVLGVSNVHEVSSAKGGVDNRVGLEASLKEWEIRSPTRSRVKKKEANVKALEGAKGQACDDQLCHVGGSLGGSLKERQWINLCVYLSV